MTGQRTIRTAVSRARNEWELFWFEPGPAARLGLARLTFCAAACAFYWPHDFTEWASAAPVFWMPIPLFETLHLTVLPPDTLWGAQTLWKISLLASAIGLLTRQSTLIAALLG